MSPEQQQQQQEQKHQRITALQRLLHETTLEAYTSIVSNHASIIGKDTLSPPPRPNDTTRHEETAAAAADAENNDRAGYEVGLALFGTSSSYREQMERELEGTLNAIETEANDIRRAMLAQDDSYHHHHHEEEGEDKEDSPPLSNSIDEMQQHIDLLQKCIEIRRSLEEVDALTLLFDRGGSGGTSSYHSLLSSSFSPSNMLFSPSSSVSSFPFDTTTDEGEASGNHTKKEEEHRSPMARAATLIRGVQDTLDAIMESWKDRTCSNLHDEDRQDEDEEGGSKSIPMHKMQFEMINEFILQTRRKKTELRYRAGAYLEKCWEVVEGRKLMIRGSNAAVGYDGGGNTKRVAFPPCDDQQPPSLSTPRDAMGNHGNQKQQRHDAIHSPLSDAYAVFEAFHDGRFPVFGETLDGVLEMLGSQLFAQVFRPCLMELDSVVSSSLASRKAGPMVVGYFRLKRESFQGAAAATGMGGRSSGGKKYDVTIKGPTVQLEWELCKMKVDSMRFVDDNNDDDDHVATRNILSVASEINEQHLAASAPTASVATFLSSLHFLTQVFEFLHRHLLQTRTDLASLMGKYLFGTYPISTSLLSGSAKLGGILVGCAAWGEETGETRPLMVQLIQFMRKWCVPTESKPEVWRLIPRIQRVLRREVDAFERKMMELGFMTVGEVATSLVGTSSPSGLSVLVNEEAMASPVDANLTLNSHCSPIEKVSPSTERSKSNNMVRSSLSEIAHAFLQVYSENQRSQILNQGRSILLSTDYHNSVQVGTFVPPPAEPGTLEHLDDDPLNAFLFQQCSISTTAQKTLELCRQTLDEAIRPEMGKELDALPPMLYRASRELLDLFRAMIPTLYASEIGSIPRMAAILHNDCVYLAHEASLLGERE
eukprot:CCRYP_004375-RB/>CCRYP_004375-RB protein AED:0.00 eAED:0.00 QI:75/1/1/1/1/1/2/3447/879